MTKVVRFIAICMLFFAGSESLFADNPESRVYSKKSLVVHAFQNLKADTLININATSRTPMRFYRQPYVCGVLNTKLSTPQYLYWIRVDEKGNWRKIKGGWVFNGTSGHRIYLKFKE